MSQTDTRRQIGGAGSLRGPVHFSTDDSGRVCVATVPSTRAMLTNKLLAPGAANSPTQDDWLAPFLLAWPLADQRSGKSAENLER